MTGTHTHTRGTEARNKTTLYRMHNKCAPIMWIVNNNNNLRYLICKMTCQCYFRLFFFSVQMKLNFLTEIGEDNSSQSENDVGIFFMCSRTIKMNREWSTSNGRRTRQSNYKRNKSVRVRNSHSVFIKYERIVFSINLNELVCEWTIDECEKSFVFIQLNSI